MEQTGRKALLEREIVIAEEKRSALIAHHLGLVFYPLPMMVMSTLKVFIPAVFVLTVKVNVT